jgi:hypothetical protein
LIFHRFSTFGKQLVIILQQSGLLAVTIAGDLPYFLKAVVTLCDIDDFDPLPAFLYLEQLSACDIT